MVSFIQINFTRINEFISLIIQLETVDFIIRKWDCIGADFEQKSFSSIIQKQMHLIKSIVSKIRYFSPNKKKKTKKEQK